MRIVIKGLNPATAWLASLLSPHADIVIIRLSESRWAMYIPELIPLWSAGALGEEPRAYTEEFLMDVLGVEFREIGAVGDVEVSSCEWPDLTQLMGGVACVDEDPMLSVATALARNLPLPSCAPKIPGLERGGEAPTITVEPVCAEPRGYLIGAFQRVDYLSGASYVPRRTIEWLMDAADVAERLLGGDPPSRSVRFDYAYGVDRSVASLGVDVGGKASRVSMGGVRARVVARLGRPIYAEAIGPHWVVEWFASLREAVRRSPFALIRDFGAFPWTRGPISVASSSLIFRRVRFIRGRE